MLTHGCGAGRPLWNRTRDVRVVRVMDEDIREWIMRRTDSGIPGHHCAVGGVPKKGTEVKVCSCGQVYAYSTGWWPFGLTLWRRASFFRKLQWRKRLAQVPFEHEVG